MKRFIKNKYPRLLKLLFKVVILQYETTNKNNYGNRDNKKMEQFRQR